MPGPGPALLEALALAQETGSVWDAVWGEMNLGNVCLAEKDAGQAEAHYRRALRVALDYAVMPIVLDALAAFAELRVLTGDQERAHQLAGLVALHPASSGNARTRTGEVLRMLNPDGANQPLALSAGTVEEIVQAILAGSYTGSAQALSA